MRVLWIANIVFPEAHALIASDDKLKASGGWMLGAAESLLNHTDISLTVASVSPMVNELIRLEGKRIIYYLLPYGKGNNRYNKEYEPLWLRVKEEVCPNVVHIHGSEYTHGLAYVRACGSKNVVVSIQGLVSVYARYYYSGLSKWNVLRNFTLRSLLGRSIFAGKKKKKKRGVLERELLQKVDHIIGRTSWDQAHAWAINPYAQYHYVGETLRRDFYDGQWNYSRCNHHTIFLSQANYAVKGLHMVLKALPLVLRQYPDVQVRVDGNDITSCDSLKKVLQYTDYGRLTRQMIKQSDLKKVVVFTGPLDAEGMKQEYLKSNVFVCPSSIENSPNSLGEAQILGVPVISAYVGGVSEMMDGDEDHMYRFEEVEMLAHKICTLFKAEGNQPQLTKMRVQALKRHNPEKNDIDLINVYNKIIG